MGFLVLWIWPFLRSVFQFSHKNIFGKNRGFFSFHFLLRFAVFPFFEHLVFGFQQKKLGVFQFGIRCGFQFSLLVSSFCSARMILIICAQRHAKLSKLQCDI